MKSMLVLFLAVIVLIAPAVGSTDSSSVLPIPDRTDEDPGERIAEQAQMPVPLKVVKSSDVKIGGQVEMSLPLGFVKDGDGNIVGQIADWETFSVALNFDGTIGLFLVRGFGLANEYNSVTPRFGSATLYDNLVYASAGCTGQAYIRAPVVSNIEGAMGVDFAVAGPDPITGGYRLYRSDGYGGSDIYIYSWWYNGVCLSGERLVYSVVPAVEVLPNPLTYLRGPTDAEPDKLWTFSGGTKLP